MPNLLVVANCPSANSRTLFEAVAAGAADESIDDVSVNALEAVDADAEDVIRASGIIIGTTENFGYMSGLVKDFFERIYYPCLEKTEGLPCALYVKGGLDGEGAKQSMERVITGLKWKPVQPTLVLRGDYSPQFKDQCKELGLLLAAGLEAGIY